MSTKNAKKIGLMASISVLVSSVIGIGIFFKNGTVFQNNDYNGIGVLISWILASLIAFTAGFSFCEIGFGKKKGAGLAGSVEVMYGKKFGRFISFNQTFFYAGIFYVSIAIFSAEAIFKVFLGSEGIKNVHMGYVMGLALVLMIIFLLFNYFASRISEKSLIVCTIIKFIPLIVVGLVGIIFGAMNPENSLFGSSPIGPDKNPIKVGAISAPGILSALPAILFAYDAFLTVGNIKYDMQNPKKQVPMTMVIGMLFCIFAYLFITIGQILTSSGIAEQVFGTIHNLKPEFNLKALGITKTILNIFIMISILGVLNAFCLSYLRVFQHSIKERILLGWWVFKNHKDNNKNRLGLLSGLVVYGFWWIILFIPSTIMNTDAFVDGLSNFPTLFMFLIYGLTILKGFINRCKKQPNEEKIKGFWIIAPIAIIGCLLAFGYQFFYKFSIETILNPNNNINWGLFFTNGFETKNWQGMLWFIFALITFIIMPFINDGTLKARYNKLDFNKLLKKQEQSVIDYQKINNELWEKLNQTKDYNLIKKIEENQYDWSLHLDEISINPELIDIDNKTIFNKEFMKKELIV